MTLTTNITKRASSWAVAFALTTASAASAATLSTSGTFGIGEIATFEFTLGAGATFLDIATTDGSTNIGRTSNGDTEIGLYSGTGEFAQLVTHDDDSGIGSLSALSFGVGSGMNLGGATAGSNGAVPAAGNYTVVIGSWNTIFSDDLGDVRTVRGNSMNYKLSLFSDGIDVAPVPLPAGGFSDGIDVAPVPLPAGGLLLISGLAGVAALKRRKAVAA